MADAPVPFEDLGPVGDGGYEVVGGDCIESISARAGFLWTAIWDHPENAALEKARVSPIHVDQFHAFNGPTRFPHPCIPRRIRRDSQAGRPRVKHGSISSVKNTSGE